MKNFEKEQTLRLLGIKYTYEKSLPRSEINIKQSLYNQARLGSTLILEHVTEIELALEGNRDISALVAYRKDGKLILMDGNHSNAAYGRRNIENCDFYIVEEDTPLELIDVATRVLNCPNGLPPTPETRLEQAIHIINVNQYSLTKVSQMTQVPISTIEDRLLYNKAQERLAKITENVRLCDSVAREISRIVQDDAYKKIANLAQSHHILLVDVKNIVQQVMRAAESKEKQDKVINDIKAELTQKSKSNSGKRILTSLTRPLKKLTELDVNIVKLYIDENTKVLVKEASIILDKLV